MTPTAWIIAAVVIVALLAVGATMWSRRRRSAELRDRFGREYDRTVDAAGDRSKAEADLAERQKRVEKLQIRALDPNERREFAERWTEV
jgi:FtsZ-interacting cell division protein ZipA